MQLALDEVRDGAVQAQREGALAAAARAEHEQRLTLWRGERDAPQRGLAAAAVLEGEVGDLEG